MRRHLPLIATAALVAACSGGADGTDPIGLEDTTPADEAPADTDTQTDTETDTDGAADDGTPADDADADATPTSGGDVVDGTEAVPGTWQVGDAGTVTFDVVDGALVLEDVSENDGWTVTDVEEAPDEIEVDFQQGDVEIEIEIELTSGGSVLEIEIDTDIENAEPGTYDIGDAGTFTFEATDSGLELVELAPAEGWDVTEESVESDEIEIELRNGAMRWDADVDLNGAIEIELDYEVSGQI